MDKRSNPEPPNRLLPEEKLDSGKIGTKYIIHRSYGERGSVEISLAKLALREKNDSY